MIMTVMPDFMIKECVREYDMIYPFVSEQISEGGIGKYNMREEAKLITSSKLGTPYNNTCKCLASEL